MLNHYYIDQPLLHWPWMESIKTSLTASNYIGHSNLFGFGVELTHHSNFAPLSVFVNIYRIMSSESALTVIILMQILICYFGCILISKFYNINPSRGILLSIAFCLNSFFISWINHITIFGAFCFLPLIYFIYIKSFISPNFIFLKIPILLFALFSGSIQTTLIISIFIILILYENKNKINQIFLINFLIANIFILFVSFPFYYDFLLGYIENLSNEGGRTLLFQFNLINILKGLLFIPISQFPLVLGSFNSYDLSKVFGVLYGIPHIPYMGTSIVMTVYCAKKIDKIYFIIPALLYLSPIKSIVYERIFIISLFSLFILGLKICSQNDISTKKLNFVKKALVTFSSIWFLGSVAYKSKNIQSFIKQFILDNIDSAYFSYKLFPVFYEKRFLNIEVDYSIFSFKNILILVSLFLTIQYLKNGNLRMVYIINLFQLSIFIFFHLSIPLTQNTVKQEIINAFPSLNLIEENSRVVVVDDNNFLFFKENILSLYNINDVDYSSDIYRSKINKIDKKTMNTQLFNNLNIDFIISKQPFTNNDFSLFYDAGEFLIYIYESNIEKKYSFINQNKIKVDCKKNHILDIPINHSQHWKNSNNIEIIKNDYGGMRVTCNSNEFLILTYEPRLYRLQPHSLLFNSIVLLFSFFMFQVKKENKKIN
tara:strand:- start:132 stop:2096 length:1965 start_codon:yes stop_codon:yes gene_type:complete